MAKTNAFAANVLKLIFQNANIAAIGDATGVRGSTTAGSLYVSLHTADPGVGGSQTTSEISYTGYARVAVSRASGVGGFDITGETITPHGNVQFGQRTDAASSTATYFGIGTDATLAGNLLYSGQITSPSGGIVVGQFVTPVLTTSTAVTES